MFVKSSTLTKVAAAALVMAALAACSTKKTAEVPAPQTPPVTTPTTPPPPPQAERPLPPPAPSVTPGSIQDFVVNVGDRVYFDLDSSSIRADARPILDAQAAWLARYPNVRVRIEGNADERGTREYNMALGARRAAAAQQYLVGRGVVPGRITTISYGKENPIDSASNEDAWAKNRNAHTAITSGAN